MSGEPDDWYWNQPDDDPYWRVHLDELAAAARKSNERAIKACIVQRWVCRVVILMQIVVAIWVLSTDRIPWLSIACIVFVAILATFNERLLESVRRRSR